MPLVDGHRILLGADPEVWVTNRVGDIVPACKLIPGTKESPHKVNKGMIQVDGLAAEFGIDPSDSLEEFTNNLKEVILQLKQYLPKGYSLRFKPTAVFDPMYLGSVTEEDLELGCQPDFNAYTGGTNAKPTPPDSVDGCVTRSAGGHVHIGWLAEPPKYSDHFSLCCAIAAEMDLQVGVDSLSWDKDKARRNLYGKAGAFRPKPYGMEYRTLSNAWVCSDETIARVYHGTIKAVENVIRGNTDTSRYQEATGLINSLN